MHIASTSFGHLGISSWKWHSHSAPSLYLSKVVNSYSIVDLVIIVCVDDHETATPPNVNT